VTDRTPAPDASLAAAFGLGGRLIACEPLKRGHIHDTFVASCESRGDTSRYVLQCLNAHVFREPEAVMENLLRVTRHQRAVLAREGAPQPERRVLRVLLARDGRPWHVDAEGRFWRGFPFVEGTVTHERPAHPAQAREAARAFGRFAASLRDLPNPPLRVTIPGFHDLAARRAALEQAVAADPHRRAGSLGREIDDARALGERMASELDEAGLPRRVVHNDCKLNNLLFDAARDEALCVVDLDTVMEGALLHDFGEIVRTATNPRPEDEPDPATVKVDLAIHEALARGYLEGAGALATPPELASLPLAGARMAFENAVRFLTDYLLGDVYFRIQRPSHNLDRHRSQMQLAKLLREARGVAERHVEAAARARGSAAG
jgi:aminoglycoside phosphotransferase (APT) family kinase protein